MSEQPYWRGDGADLRAVVMNRTEHVVTMVNAYCFVCDVCGEMGSERWAILHQFPSRRLVGPWRTVEEKR
ncbi:hypothetical protein MHAEM_21191 [Mycolicibacterium phlei]|nr:hypothetical protein [Mycolicibacterium phlei]